MKISEIEGLGEVFCKKLEEIGIATVEALLEKGATPAGRKEIAEKTGISPKIILRSVNHADLFRIKGVSSQYADLLEEAGVDTVVELAGRRADNLAAKMAAINEEKNLVRKVPTESQVADWIAQAKELPRAVHY